MAGAWGPGRAAQALERKAVSMVVCLGFCSLTAPHLPLHCPDLHIQALGSPSIMCQGQLCPTLHNKSKRMKAVHCGVSAGHWVGGQGGAACDSLPHPDRCSEKVRFRCFCVFPHNAELPKRALGGVVS